MKFNRTEIGGRETGAVAIRPLGKTTLDDALAYANVGRTILGNLKQRLQLGDVKVGMDQQILPDGTVIRVKTNMIGLAPIDSIEVDTSQRKSEKGGMAIIGYIVQAMASDANNYNDFEFDLETPTGKTLNSALNGTYINPDWAFSDPLENFDGYPDNGAKYFQLGDYDAGTDSIIPNDYQEVFVRDRKDWTDYEGSGPTYWTQKTPPYGSLPGINGGWFYATSNEASPGASLPGSFTFNDINIYQYVCSEGAPYHDVLESFTAYPYTWNTITGSTASYIGDTPWDGTGLTELEWKGQVMSYDVHTNIVPVVLPYCNAALSISYDSWMANAYKAVHVNTYSSLYPKPVGGIGRNVGALFRRVDGAGFVTNSGFQVGNAQSPFVFTPQGKQSATTDGDGDCCLFMIPSGERRIYSYFTDWDQTFYDGSASVTETTITDVGDYPILPGDGVGDPITWEFYVDYHNNEVIKTRTRAGTIQGAFGLPCNVEGGVHTVTIKGVDGDVWVWLLVRERKGVTDKVGFVKVRHDIVGDGNSSTVDLTVKVTVGPTQNPYSAVQFI